MTYEDVTYSRKRRQNPVNIYALGNKHRTKRMMQETPTGVRTLEGIDFLDTIKELSTDPALHLLADLIQAKDPSTNTVLYDSTQLNPTEKNRVSKGYKQLEGMNLIYRLKRGTYLVNPRLSPPYDDYFDRVCLHWLQATGKNP